MVTPRTPRSRFYDGAVYGRLLAPLMSGLHARIAREIPAGQRILEAGCGTGHLALLLAPEAEEVVGVELSPRMHEYATRRARERGADNASFLLGDVCAVLTDRPAGSFDLALTVMVVHEMPADARGPVLRELARLADRVMCVDFRVPMPWNLAGMRNRLLEGVAGPEHFRAFLDYTRRGGLPAIAGAADLSCEHVRDIDAGTLSICELTLA